MFLRRKNAKGGTDGKTEKASIRKSGKSLIDPFTEQRQVTVECAIIEGPQFDLNGGSIWHDRARELEERDESQPGSMSPHSAV